MRRVHNQLYQSLQAPKQHPALQNLISSSWYQQVFYCPWPPLYACLHSLPLLNQNEEHQPVTLISGQVPSCTSNQSKPWLPSKVGILPEYHTGFTEVFGNASDLHPHHFMYDVSSPLIVLLINSIQDTGSRKKWACTEIWVTLTSTKLWWLDDWKDNCFL